MTYVVLAQRHNALVSCLGAVAVWIALASIIRSVSWTLAGGLIANAIAFAICVPLLRRFRHVKMPLITRRWYDIPLRAALVATLVATVVTASGWVVPKSEPYQKPDGTTCREVTQNVSKNGQTQSQDVTLCRTQVAQADGSNWVIPQ